MNIPLSWQMLLNIESEPKKITPQYRKKLEERLKQLEAMELRWCDVELNLEKRQLQSFLNKF